MQAVVWSDKMGPRRRAAWLLLITPEKVHIFQGKTIPGVVAVVGTDYEKAGAWSHTTYRLEVADGVQVIAGRDGFETGRFTEGLANALGIGPIDRWQDLANALGVTLSVAQEFVRSWRPKAAERLDQVEKDLDTIDAEAGDAGADVVAITIGCPRRRDLEAGYWSWPIRVIDQHGQEVGRVWKVDGRWEASGCVKILGAEHIAGPRGGWWSFRLAVPDGSSVVHP